MHMRARKQPSKDWLLRFSYGGLIVALLVCAIAACSGQTDRLDDGELLPSEPFGELHDPAFDSFPQRTIQFDVSEGTHISVDISPDGERLVFDLLGDLYLVPSTGGKAKPLTRGRSWDQAPTFSPDGKRIAFVSDRVGFKNLWLIDLETQRLEQVTRLDSDVMGSPNWSESGDSLIVGRSKPNDTEVILEIINPKNGEISQVAEPVGDSFDYDRFIRLRPSEKMYTGVKTRDEILYFDKMATSPSLGRRVIRLYEFDIMTGESRSLTPQSASYSEYKPQLSNNGALIAYFRQYQDRRTELRLYDRRTEQSTPIVELPDRDDASFGPTTEATPNYAFSPNDKHLFLWHEGDLTRVRIEDGAIETIEFTASVELDVWQTIRPKPAQHNHARVVRWPTTSRSTSEVFVNAFGYVWRIDADAGHVSRVTNSDDLEFMPSVAPDGRTVAFVRFDASGERSATGRLVLADAETGKTRELLNVDGERFLFPTWSPDGSKIAVIREAGDPGAWTAEIGWTAVDDPMFHSVADIPSSSDYPSLWVNSRSIGFDATSQNLIYSYRNTLTETVLKTSDLEGGNQKTLAIGTDEIGGLSAAPDLKHLALTRRDGTVWMTPFDQSHEPATISSLSSNATFVGTAGHYLNWVDSDELIFAYGSTVYEYSVPNANLKSSEVRVGLPDLGNEKSVVFTNARLITMTDDHRADQVIETGALLVEGTHISAVGPIGTIPIPDEAIVIDLTGKTIIPGLSDTHYHRIGGGFGIESSSGLQLPNARFEDASAIAYGVTSAWEPGGPADDGIPASADLQWAGRILGPRWSYSAIGPLGFPFDLFENYQDAEQAILRNKALGVDVAKEYDTPTRLQRQWLAKAAYEHGLGIVAHIENYDGFLTRIVDGYTGGDHALFPLPFYDDVSQLLEQTDFIWTPNVSAPGGNVGEVYASRYYFWAAFLDHRPDEQAKLNAISPGAVEFWNSLEPDIPYELHRVSRVAKQTAQSAAKGVAISVSAHDMPGILLHGELWYLWKGGMPIHDVLRAATMGNAEKLGLQDQVGSLEADKYADFLILSDNPLDNIINTLSIEYTVQGGLIYQALNQELVDPNEITTAAARKANWPNVRFVSMDAVQPGLLHGPTHFCEIHGEWHAFHRPFRSLHEGSLMVSLGAENRSRAGASFVTDSQLPKSFAKWPYFLRRSFGDRSDAPESIDSATELQNDEKIFQ